MRSSRPFIALTLTALALAAPADAARERSAVPVKYTWNLDDLFPGEAAWRAALEQLKKDTAGLAAYRGHAGASADMLWKTLDAAFAARLRFERLDTYAQLLSDQDVRVGHARELRLAAAQAGTDLAAARAFIEPELLALEPARVKAFVAADPRLAAYAFYLDDLLRRRVHTLSGPEEKIVAEAGNLAHAGGSTYGVLAEADLPYPTVKLSTGEVRLDAAAYALHRAAPNRADRDLVFQAFFGALKTYERTMGTTLEAEVKAHLFTKKVRGFGSALEAALFSDNIPPAVYRQLIADVHRSLPTLHRYLALRRRMLGLDKLRYQDLYVPLGAGVDLSFDPEQARAITLEAVAPLGPEYVATLKKGFESRWTDYLPSTGKRSGAYSTGVYGVHPYQLLNFNGKYDDLSALAHESGHSMHTFLANAAQPYPTSSYPIFVAEVASTLNENLLFHHMLGRAKDDATRLALLASYLDEIRGSLFRQTQFAEFELAMHEMAERGEPITGEALTALNLKLLREYYGHDQGICTVDDLLGVEWAYIPHFYGNFYVYQYATSIVASISLARAILAEAPSKKTQARDRTLAMLRAGGSRYPIELLQAAGVDPLTSKPFDAAIAEMNAMMDEMEKILERQRKR